MDAGEGRWLRKLDGGWLGPVHIEEHAGGTQVVVKTIRPAFLQDPPAWSRLLALAAGQKQPADPGLVAVLSCTPLDDGGVAWAMPFIDGEELALYATRHPAQAASSSLWIAREIARLLCAGLPHGYHHLALRPSQVLITPSRGGATSLSVSVLGLGVMQAVGWQRPGTVPAAARIYRAPEQASAATGTLDERCDVYALGVLLIHLLQGKAPTQDDVARAHAGLLLSASAARPDTARLVGRMLLPDAAQRPTLQEVVQTLSQEDQAARLNATLAPDTAEAGPATANVTGMRTAPAPAPQFVATLPPLADEAPLRTPHGATDPYVATLAPDDGNAHGATADDDPANPVRSDGKRTAPTPPVQSSLQHAGLLYGNFRIVRRIGRGGMGVVYEAEHQQIGRRAAVKILHPSFAARPDFATRFLNEARAVNIVRHPGLVEIFEYGQQPDGTLYIVMELLQGESLRARLQKGAQPHPLRQILGWSLQIARALCATHEKGIIHRDLKPENIMVIPDPLRAGQDWVKLLDFGIAKVGAASNEPATTAGPADEVGGSPSETAAGTAMGTPVYMAPEQDSSAATVDGMADVFSFGVMLYEMIAGRRPYKETWVGLRTTAPESLQALRADVPPDLSALVLHMLALGPAERPMMAEVLARLSEIADRLEAAARADAKTVREQQHTQQAQAHIRRRRLAFAATGFLGVVLAVSGFWGYRMLHVPTLAEARERALQQVKRSLGSNDGHEGLLAVQALAKSRDADYRPLLEPLLGNVKGPLTAAAARGLGHMSAVESQGALLAILDKTQDPAVRMETAAALAQLSHPKGLDTLRTLLQQGDDATKLEAALRLLEFGDASGADLLHKLMNGPGPGPGPMEDRQLPVLAGLARAGDPQARQQLTQRFQAALSVGKPEPLLAFSLARLGEPAARRELARMASQAGSDQVMAARFLSALGQADGYPVLLSAGADNKVPERLREVAFDGLGDSGQTTAASMMVRTLDEAAVTSRFRLSAAGSILQLAGGTAGSTVHRSFIWARAALASDSSATRQLAVMLLGDLESDETIAPLRQALKDQEREVRGGAAHALGNKTKQAALLALADALDDADEEIRTAAMRSIGQVAKALQNQGERNAAASVIARLQALIEKGTAVDRVVAAGTLLLLGDNQQVDVLRQGLRATSAQVRRLAAERLDADTTLLKAALQDTDSLVRFAAACRLAALGLRDGTAVLRVSVSEGGTDGLWAYSLLLKLGETVSPPRDLRSLLMGRSLREKEFILSLLPDLPANIALDLLLRAAVDPSNMLRRRSAQLAFDLFQRTLQNAFRHLLFELRNDADVVVRSRAAELIGKLPNLTPANSGPDADRLTPHAGLGSKADDDALKTVGGAGGDPVAKPAAPVLPTQSKPAKSATKATPAAGGAMATAPPKNDPRAKSMGLIQVFVMKKGRCQMTQQYYLPPGDHIVNVAGGASQTVSVYAGSVIPLRQCP
jgi:serine/threonine protein kinase/HEAT repeat protein